MTGMRRGNPRARGKWPGGTVIVGHGDRRTPVPPSGALGKGVVEADHPPAKGKRVSLRAFLRNQQPYLKALFQPLEGWSFPYGITW